MSDDVTENDGSEYADPAEAAKRGRGRPPRTQTQRTQFLRSQVSRTFADAARAGVASDPRPAERAEVAREPSTPEAALPPRQRMGGGRTINPLELPQRRKKPGFDYEWKTIRVLNEPADASGLVWSMQQGWRPELARDWPELVLPGTAPDSHIESQGLRLYSRPMNYTVEARQESLDNANDLQRNRMRAAATGQSAVRGEEGMPNNRLVKTVPLEITLEGVAG